MLISYTVTTDVLINTGHDGKALLSRLTGQDQSC